jgi:hypothetical protein
MPSSTSSSERLTAADRPGVAQPVPVRDIPDRPWPLMLLGALLLAIAFTGAWEWHWREYGVVPGMRDDEALWARQRRRIDSGEGDATVLVGSSRTFFDIALPVWERASGRRPIQLALVGTSPLFALEDLAVDPSFRGRVLVGVAPDLFFSGYEYRSGFLKAFQKESPSQRVGKWLSMKLVEPHLAFYDPDYAVFTILRRQDWPARKDLEGGTAVRKLSISEADRYSYMWSKLETDADYRALARRIWTEDFKPLPTKEAAERQQTIDKQIKRAAAAFARLRARGVPVVFVRHPSVGDYLAFENRDFPRLKTWDVFLAKSGAPGIYFEDYPELRSGYELPEWSHMTRASAERYTAALYRILERDFAPADGTRW